MNTSHNGQPEHPGQDLAQLPSAPARRIKCTTKAPDAAAMADPDLAAAAIQARARRRAGPGCTAASPGSSGAGTSRPRAAFAMLTHGGRARRARPRSPPGPLTARP